MIGVIAAASVIVIVAVIAVVLGSGNSPSKPSASVTSITGRPVANAVAASNLSAVRQSTSVLVTWNDTNNHHYPYLLEITDSTGTVLSRTVVGAVNTSLLNGDTVPSGGCVVVVTVNGAGSPPQSAAACP